MYIPLKVIFKLSIVYFFFTVLIILLIVLFTLAATLLLGTFVVRFKEDALPILWAFDLLAWSVFPVSFSLMIFPEPIRTYLEIFVPSFAVIEEIRKLAILGDFNIQILSLAILVSFIYLALSITIFVRIYEKGRKDGWLYLK